MVNKAEMEFSENEEDLLEYLEDSDVKYYKKVINKNICYVVNNEFIVEFSRL